jgi:hypothetical protein
MVNSVIVDERREMHQLDHRRKRKRVVMVSPRDTTRQQQKRRPEQLPTHEQKVLVHFLDMIKVGQDDPADLIPHSLQWLTYRGLDGGQLRRCGLRGLTHLAFFERLRRGD